MKIILKNRYSRYLEQAQLLEKDRKFETAKILYKKCIEINPNDDFSLERIKKIDDINNYSYCICDEETLCPRYGMNMDGYFINNSWCKSANSEDRERLYKIKNQYHNYHLYGTETLDNQCLLANIHQEQKQTRINLVKDRISKSKDFKFNRFKKNQNLDNVKILCLGHSDKQFNLIKERKYLSKVNLNELNAGEYSDNDWAESRAFIAKEKLFPDTAEFLGFTTASWNKKYSSDIDNFHNWEDVNLLINSKPEDKIVLCGNLYCSCLYCSNHSYFYIMYKREHVKTIFRSFIRYMNIKDRRHILVPYANQMIAHRSIIEEYTTHLKDADVFKKVDYFVKSISKNVSYNDIFIKNKYYNVRINGYFMEMYTCLWFASKDYIYLSQHSGKLDNWYSTSSCDERSKKWL
jgi:hypothetical protein